MVDPAVAAALIAANAADPALATAAASVGYDLGVPVADGPTAEETAPPLLVALGVLYRQIRQTKLLGDLSLPESSALSHLRRHGPSTSARLAKLERISPQSMGSTVAALEAKGLITRSADPADGRRVLIALSESGAETVALKRDHRVRQLTQALEHLSAEERAALLDALPLLDRIAENLQS